MNFLRKIFGPSIKDLEIQILKKRVETCENQIEKIMELVDSLATFDQAFSKELRNLNACVALLDATKVSKKSLGSSLPRRKSNGDDIIN